MSDLGNNFDWAKLLEEAGDLDDFQLVPPGTYDCIVTRCEVVTASTGKSMYKTWFKVENGPYANKGGIINNFVVSEGNSQAMRMFFTHMRALGLPGTMFMQVKDKQQVAQTILGRRCRLTLSHRKYNDRDQYEINNILPPTTPQDPAVLAPTPLGAAAGPSPTMPGGNGNGSTIPGGISSSPPSGPIPTTPQDQTSSTQAQPSNGGVVDFNTPMPSFRPDEPENEDAPDPFEGIAAEPQRSSQPAANAPTPPF